MVLRAKAKRMSSRLSKREPSGHLARHLERNSQGPERHGIHHRDLDRFFGHLNIGQGCGRRTTKCSLRAVFSPGAVEIM